MNRRTLLKSIGSAGVLGAASPLLRSQEQVARATRGMATPRIKDISVIECEPADDAIEAESRDAIGRPDVAEPHPNGKYLSPCQPLPSGIRSHSLWHTDCLL